MLVHKPCHHSLAHRAGQRYVINQVSVRIARKRDVGVPVLRVAVRDLGDHVHYTSSLDRELRMPPHHGVPDIAAVASKPGYITV